MKLYYEHLKAYPWLNSFQLPAVTWIMRPQLCGKLLGQEKGRTRVIWRQEPGWSWQKSHPWLQALPRDQALVAFRDKELSVSAEGGQLPHER